MKKITLNSLVFLVDLTPEQVSGQFQNHEIISAKGISNLLFGEASRPDLVATVYQELDRLVMARLALGQRAVVDAPLMRKEARQALVSMVNTAGYNAYYLVNTELNRHDNLRGDRAIEFAQWGHHNTVIVRSLPDAGFLQEIEARGYRGVTVIADVHGMMNPLRNAISWAKNRGNFMLFLGDVLDYGIDTLEVVDSVYQLIIRGEAEAVMGNHERKIFRHLYPKGKPSNMSHMSHGNRVTIDRVNALSAFDRERWVNRFLAMVHLMRNHRTDGNFIFAHGAVSPEMWTTNDFRLSSSLEDMTLFGEVDDSVKKGDYPNRVYNWVDSLLENQTAVVGHDIRSNAAPFNHVGLGGGKAVFLDTGCGKGGNLSTLDIRFTPTGPRIENSNIH